MSLKKLAKATNGLLGQRSSRVGDLAGRRAAGEAAELIAGENAPPADRRSRAGDLMTASDAGRILGVSVDMVRVLARNGELPYQSTIGGVRLFKRSDVDALGRRRERVRSGARIKRTR